MIKAVIFDLDGTLADTIVSIATATNMVLEKLGLAPHPVERYNYFAGDGASTLVERALIEAGDKELVHFEEAYTAYKEFFATNCTYKVRVFDGLKSVLDRMKEKGIKLAVLTNKPHERAVDVVEYLFGKDYFEVVLGEQEGIKRKPANEGALIIAKKLQVPPKECMYVGDTNVDMQTGKGAGMFTVGVLWGFRPRAELEAYHADAIATKVEELESLVEMR